MVGTDIMAIVIGTVVQSSPSQAVCSCFRVKSYEYFMNGMSIGILYLNRPEMQCAWYSKLTKKKTKWHGRWYATDTGGIVAYFNCQGKRDKRKWIAVGYTGYGLDHRTRAIEIVLDKTWIFDAREKSYLIEIYEDDPQ